MADHREHIEPEIAREMTIEAIEIPKFEPSIRGEDLQDFGKRDQKMLLSFSVLEQKLNFVVDCFVSQNKHQRYLEAELIRQRKAQTKLNFRSAFTGWIGVTIGAGVIAAIIKKIFELIW